MTDLTPPTQEEVDLATRRERARQHQHMYLNSEAEWARSLYTEEDRLLLEGDTPTQRKADFDTVQRKRDWEKLQRRRRRVKS